jgi:hypothetical protein
MSQAPGSRIIAFATWLLALLGAGLRACPDTQVGCGWCDWLCRARRRLMMMIIDQ